MVVKMVMFRFMSARHEYILGSLGLCENCQISASVHISYVSVIVA